MFISYDIFSQYINDPFASLSHNMLQTWLYVKFYLELLKKVFLAIIC